MRLLSASLFLGLFFIHSTVLALTLEPVIGPPLAPAQAGQPLIFSVYYHNSGSHAVTLSVPDQLACQFISGQKRKDTTARRIEPMGDTPITVAAGGFIKARFRLLLAKDTPSQVQLVVPDISPTALLIAVGHSAPASQPDESFSWTSRTTDPPMDALIALYQPYVKNISFYKPMYFLVGTDPEKSKFQVSFKYRFFNPEKPLAQRYPWVEGFHLGYTQTSFWDLGSDSAPFEDTSYQPEIYFITPRIKTSFPSLDGLFIKTGFQHESNGRGGTMSRSTNFAYIQPILLFYNEQKRSGIKLSTKLWCYVDNEEENNPDIEDYRGYFDLGITFGKADGLVIDTNFQWADKGASVQVDATYPLDGLFFDHLDMYLHLNYSNTLAESLINYTEREEAFRIGLSIVR